MVWVHTTVAHVSMLSLATAAAVAFGCVAFSGVVVGGGGSRVHSEMGLQAVLSPTALCPSFAIKLGDTLNVCWGFGSCYLCFAHRDCDFLSWVFCYFCASELEPGCRQHVPSWAHRATLSPVTLVWQ